MWAVWEVGFDWWQLAPRGGLVVLLGVVLALPGITRSFGKHPGRLSRAGGWIALCGVLVACVGVAAAAMLAAPHDRKGTLPVATRGAAAMATAGVPPGEWHAYGRTPHGRRYSPLEQITPANIAKLQKMWTYHTGYVRGKADPTETTYEVTPLMIRDTLYLCAPHHIVIALDAETGSEKWRFDPRSSNRTPTRHNTSHVAACPTTMGRRQRPRHQSRKPGRTACTERLFLPTTDARLIAISASTGAVCSGFGGEDGAVDLWQNMPNVTPGSYDSTSPPAVAKEAIIVGSAVNDNVSVNETSGVIGAFDINTGALVWNWDSVRVPAIVIVTKQGDIYVLDRRTGQPILPVTGQPGRRNGPRLASRLQAWAA